jgi:hypothetical protein
MMYIILGTYVLYRKLYSANHFDGGGDGAQGQCVWHKPPHRRSMVYYRWWHLTIELWFEGGRISVVGP